MARMRAPRFKKCRSLGLNVSGHPKAMNREVPGQNRASKKLSSYGLQLLEKQRLRHYYEVMEKQFKRYVLKAIKSSETTGDALIKLLETRLDNVVYRLNFSSTLRQGRQMVVHGHILVNGRKVDRPSFEVAPGDVIELKESKQGVELFKNNFNTISTLPYFEKDIEHFKGTLKRLPERHEVPILIDDHLVVEYYSKAM